MRNKNLLNYLLLILLMLSHGISRGGIMEEEKKEIKKGIKLFSLSPAPADMIPNIYGRTKIDIAFNSLNNQLDAIANQFEICRPWCLYQLIKINVLYGNYRSTLYGSSYLQSALEEAHGYAKLFLKKHIHFPNDEKEAKFQAKVIKFIEENGLSEQCKDATGECAGMQTLVGLRYY